MGKMAWGKRTSTAQSVLKWAAMAGAAGLCAICLPVDQVRGQTTTPEAAPATAEAAQKTAKQKPKTKPAAEEAKAAKKDPAVAQQQIDAGVAALQAGKADQAVQQLTAALSGGSLPPALMARAQYQRGLAYRKQSKPALAIADLTQSLYIKNGLNETDRADALQNRIAAYRDAGLPDQDDGQSAKIGSKARAAAAESPAATAAATSTASLPSAKPTAGLAAAQEAAPTTGDGGGLSGFFGNLFGGSSSNANAAPVPATAPKQEVATSAWSAGTEVKIPAKPAKQAKAAAEPTAAAAPSRQAAATKTGSIVTAAAGGRYVLQVAQLKTREEAEAVASQIKQQFANELAGREASIVAVNQGGFGTLHRVSFGPFTDASEWKSVCPKLLGARHDCQPLSQ
jgi:hypothetical protein